MDHDNAIPNNVFSLIIGEDVTSMLQANLNHSCQFALFSFLGNSNSITKLTLGNMFLKNYLSEYWHYKWKVCKGVSNGS